MSKFIAIDLDAQGLFVATGTARGGSAKVEQAFAWAGTEADGGPPALTVETARRVGEQLRDRLRAAGVGNAPVLVCVPRDRVVLKELKYPAVPPAEEPNVVRFQAIKELSDSPDDVVIDYVPLSNGAGEGERRSMAVAVRKDLFRAIQQMCVAANIRLAAVTARPFAVAAGIGRAFAAGTLPAPETRSEAVAILTPGPGGGEFTVARPGEVTFTRTVPGPVVASEPMLLAEVRRNLTMYAGANPGHPVRALYVAEADGRWADRLGPALGIPVHAFDPLGPSAPDVPEPLRGRFAGAAGLLAARSVGDLPINFVTPRQPKVEGDPKRTQLLVGVLAALLLLGAGAALGWYLLDSADRDLAAKTARRDSLKKEAEELAGDQKRLAAAEGWRNRQIVWLDELYDMADRFPAGDARATSFTGKAVLPSATAAKGPKQDKSDKVENQGTIEVKVVAGTAEPIKALREAIDRDAADPAPDPRAKGKPPAKFYHGASAPVSTQGKGEDTEYVATVTTGVNHRPPEKYVRLPFGFTPPDRRHYPPAVAAPKEKEKEPEPADKKDDKKEAPEPRAKEAGGGE